VYQVSFFDARDYNDNDATGNLKTGELISLLEKANERGNCFVHLIARVIARNKQGGPGAAESAVLSSPVKNNHPVATVPPHATSHGVYQPNNRAVAASAPTEYCATKTQEVPSAVTSEIPRGSNPVVVIGALPISKHAADKSATIAKKTCVAKYQMKPASPARAGGNARGFGGGATKAAKDGIKVLRTLKYLRVTFKKTNPLRKHVASLSGFQWNSTFKNTLTNYRQRGWVDFPSSDTVCITAAGMEEAGPDAGDTPRSTEELHEEIKRKHLSGRKIELFDLMADGKVHERKALAERMGAKFNSTFTNELWRMGQLYIVENVGRGKVRLADICFPYGRPE